MDRIDARGLSCPQPVVLVKNHIEKTDSNAFEVLVDLGTARDNVARFATSARWKVDINEEGDDFLLTVRK